MASSSRAASDGSSCPSITSNLVSGGNVVQPASPNPTPNLDHNTQLPRIPEQNVVEPENPNPNPTGEDAQPANIRAGKRKATDQAGKGRGKSKVWECFTRCTLLDGSVDKEQAKCNYCEAVVPANSSRNGTTSMWLHGRKCRPSPLFEKVLDHGQTTISRDNVTGAPQYHSFNQERIDQACFKMIIRDELPFRHVEGVGFKEFLYEAQPRWKQPSRKVVARGVWEMYLIEKAKMMSTLACNASRISVTTDTWTSIQNINYMVVTAHFMDSDWNLHKRIINFCSITSHKGEDIGRVLESCLHQWDITRVFTITVDNASANDVAVTYMKRRLGNMKTLTFGGDFLHLRCACHIINLIVKDGIDELEDGIEAIWHCVKFIRSSSSRLDKFREFSVLEHLNKNANVPLDVITRWNSTYLMLDAALKYEKVFDRMSYDDLQFRAYFEEKDHKGKKRVGPPCEDDWRNAQAFVHFLGKFYESTLKMSAWKHVTAHLLFSEMILLQTEINKKIADRRDPVLQRVATGMKAKFDKYWGSFEGINKTCAIIIANVLDPRWKLHYQKVAFETVGMPPEKVAAITAELKKNLMKMYDEYRGCESSSSQTTAGDGVAAMEGLEFEAGNDILAHVMKERMEEQHVMISNEVDKYLADHYVNPLTRGFDIAQWWKQNAGAYPILSKLAKDILAIPCSTVASENAFSLGKRVVDPFRSSLTPQMVEALVCTSDWLRAEQPNFYREPTKEELELYQSCEELERETAAMHLGASPLNSATTAGQ